MPRTEAERAAETLAYWCHLDDPVTNSETYAVLIDGLASARREYTAARFAHDHDRAERALAEVRDLTELAGAVAEGIARQRARWMASGDPWPLGRVTVG